MKKKLFSILLITLILANSFTIFGTSSFNQNPHPGVQNILDEAEKFISVMQSYPELFGLSAAYEGNLYLGQPIPAYRTSDTKLEEISAVEYYPVLDSTNSPVVILLISQDTQGNVHITSDISLVQGMAKQNQLALDTGLTFIFDDSQGYVKSGQTVTPILQIQPAAEKHRTPLTSSHLTTETLEQTELEATYLLYTSVASTVSAYGLTRATEQYYIDLPCYKQLLDLSCWAACTRSIGEHYSPDVSKTEANIYATCGIPYSNVYGGSLYNANYALSSLYRYTGSVHSFHKSMSFSAVGNYLRLNYPLLANSITTEDYLNGDYLDGENSIIGHAVAIRGYYHSPDFGIYTFMDPATGTYRGSNVTTDKHYTYLSVDGEEFTVLSVLI